MGVVAKAVSEKLKGNRPSPPRALVVAVVVGAVVAAGTYKALRA
jgi:hypothetical protein